MVPTAASTTARLWSIAASSLLFAGYGLCDDGAKSDPSFRGFHVDGDTTDTIMCDDGFTFRTSAAATATLARCCEVGVNPPNFVRSCEDNMLQWDNGDREACPDDYSCLTVTMFDTYLGGSETASPRATDLLCGKDWPATSLYRALAEETTATPSSSSSSGSSATTTDSPSSATTSADSDDDDDDDDDDDNSSTNGGVIAGSVIGSVAGVALLGSAAFWFFIRRRRKTAEGHSRMDDDDDPSDLPPVPPKELGPGGGAAAAGVARSQSGYESRSGAGSGSPGGRNNGFGGASDSVSSPGGTFVSQDGAFVSSPRSPADAGKPFAEQHPARTEVYEMPGSVVAVEMAADERRRADLDRASRRMTREENWLHNP